MPFIALAWAALIAWIVIDYRKNRRWFRPDPFGICRFVYRRGRALVGRLTGR